MKKQTVGWIYFIQGGQVDYGGFNGTHPIKIGYSRDPSTRVKELQTASPIPFRLVLAFSGTFRDETALHRMFAYLRQTGEWYRPDEDLRRFLFQQEWENPDVFPWSFHPRPLARMPGFIGRNGNYVTARML